MNCNTSLYFLKYNFNYKDDEENNINPLFNNNIT